MREERDELTMSTNTLTNGMQNLTVRIEELQAENNGLQEQVGDAAGTCGAAALRRPGCSRRCTACWCDDAGTPLPSLAPLRQLLTAAS
jgi:hypothetical protein